MIVGFVLPQSADTALLFPHGIFQVLIEPHKLGLVLFLKSLKLPSRQFANVFENGGHLGGKDGVLFAVFVHVQRISHQQ